MWGWSGSHCSCAQIWWTCVIKHEARKSVFKPFWGRSNCCEKRLYYLRRVHLSFSVCPSVRSSFRMNQRGSHLTNIREIWYWRLLSISVENREKNMRHFTWRPAYILFLLAKLNRYKTALFEWYSTGCWSSQRGINSARMRHDGVVCVHCLYMFKTYIRLNYINFTKSLVEAFGAHSFKDESRC
jgi:hypothetical protein